MKNSKGKFELNKNTVKKMLKSEEVMKIAATEGAKLGNIEEQYIGTQRAWVKGTEK